MKTSVLSTIVVLAALCATAPSQGAGFSLVHSFSGLGAEGITPVAPVVLDSSGVLYGTTQNAGAFSAGTVFKVKTDRIGYAVVHSFAGGTADGSLPNAALVLDSGGNLYGTTTSGGVYGSGLGTVFAILGAAPVPVPNLLGVGRLALAAGLAAVAFFVLRRRSGLGA